MPRQNSKTDDLKSYCIQVSEHTNSAPHVVSHLITESHRAGITGLDFCDTTHLFFLRGSLTLEAVEHISCELMADPVTQAVCVTEADSRAASPQPIDHTIEVMLLPGVTDSVAENVLRAAALLGVTGLTQVATGQRYLLRGTLDQRQLNKLAVEVLSNPVIQRYEIDKPFTAPFFPYTRVDETVEVIALREATDEELTAISASRRLALDLVEMQAIQAHFRQQRREPTDCEIETLAQTWSEHCSHKSFNALIDFEGPGSQRDSIDGLLKTAIRAATERVDKVWVRSAFTDNAGVIAFDDQWDLAFKVETHNHPSSLEPFGGANTGVGGVIRDILGVSSRPIANTDVLCFGPPDLPKADLPPGVLDPNRVAAGVIAGVEDYGNKMGIPTVNGAILYHRGYTANPLVFCGCLGILPRGSHVTKPQPGDLVIVIGGRTGRDGLRGATFSSMAMDQTTGEIAGSAVQIGHPINEKQVLEVVLRARDEGLYHAITDCGAGGLSSAVGEMARECGARVQLESVPLKYPGLRPWEIWLSEAQERMVLAVPPENWQRLQALCVGQDVEAVCVGTFESDEWLHLAYGAQPVGSLPVDFLHKGLPRRQLKAVWNAAVQQPGLTFPEPSDLTPSLLALLGHPNIRSKEAVIRRYDHEVQGGTAVKPLVGKADHGPSDAAVLVPLETLAKQPNSSSGNIQQGVVLSAGICPAYSEIDPYAMAWAAVDEAMRNAVAVGADPDRIALLDNFCWGNPNQPDRLGALVRCAQGCHDAAVAYGAPFISGKDSMNNEYTGGDGQRHAIPGTLLISAVGIVPDVRRTVTMDLKAPGNRLYCVGETSAEMGGSHYALLQGQAGGLPPQPVSNPLERLRALYQAIATDLVQSCHDCSEGGIGVALAEMCLAGRLGADVSLTMANVERGDVALFSESLGRFVVEVRPGDAQAFETALNGVYVEPIGTVNDSGTLRITIGQRTIVEAAVDDLENAWREPQNEPEQGTSPASQNMAAVAVPARPARMGLKRVIVLTAKGTNRDREAALACQLAGAETEIVSVHQILAGERHLANYNMLVVPGGFSYGDDLGAGTLMALDLRHRLKESLLRFIAEGRPVLGICNGFQVLVKAGLLPGSSLAPGTSRPLTLTHNQSAHFECRWVYLQPNPHSPCLFTAGLSELIYCPVAHGEGRLVIQDAATAQTIQTMGLNALMYVDADGNPGLYPANPNGSQLSIAGLCNPAGNVLGLMPHPEDHIFFWQHPRWRRGETRQVGLTLFENGVKSA